MLSNFWIILLNSGIRAHTFPEAEASWIAWKVYMTKKITACYIRPLGLLAIFKSVKGWKKRPVSFSIIPVFQRENLWEEANIYHLDRVNFIGSLFASLQLFTVRSQLAPRVN